MSEVFTPRQKEVVSEMCKGKSNKEIARTLHISEATVKLHLTSIFIKLGVNNRTRAIVKVSETIQHIDKEQAAFNSVPDTVDQIASNLVREGINKHKARTLAVHFIRLVQRGMSPNPENDDTKSQCVADVDEKTGWASVKNVTEYIDDLRGGADE
jgi:DNA-binding CsgD family transcriptional regulator